MMEKIEKKRYAIFDLDGTLLDTLEDLTDSMNVILGRYSFPLRSILEIKSFVGNGVRKLVERAIPAENRSDILFVDRLYREFSLYYNEHCMIKTDLYPGIREMLTTLIDHGYACAIVSNKIDSAVKELSETYFGELMVSSIGEKPEVKPKPASDMVKRAMEEMGADSQNSVYIGDSEVDIATAKNAGISSVTVLWGFRERDFLIEKGAECLVSDTEELTRVLLEFRQ